MRHIVASRTSIWETEFCKISRNVEHGYFYEKSVIIGYDFLDFVASPHSTKSRTQLCIVRRANQKFEILCLKTEEIMPQVSSLQFYRYTIYISELNCSIW